MQSHFPLKRAISDTNLSLLTSKGETQKRPYEESDSIQLIVVVSGSMEEHKYDYAEMKLDEKGKK